MLLSGFSCRRGSGSGGSFVMRLRLRAGSVRAAPDVGAAGGRHAAVGAAAAEDLVEGKVLHAAPLARGRIGCVGNRLRLAERDGRVGVPGAGAVGERHGKGVVGAEGG